MIGIRARISATTRPADPGRKWAIIACVVPWIGACDTLDSLKPAVRDSDAIEIPGVVGSWRSPDTTVLEIRQVGQRPPEYLITGEVAEEETNAVSSTGTAVNGGSREIRSAETNSPVRKHRKWRTWYDVRVGLLGGRLVAQFRPSTLGDSALRRAVDTYTPQIRLTYMVAVLKLNGDSLQLFYIRTDSAYSVLQRGLCLGPFVTTEAGLGPPSVSLTGTSEEVRKSYDCLLRQPGIVEESGVLQRIVPH